MQRLGAINSWPVPPTKTQIYHKPLRPSFMSQTLPPEGYLVKPGLFAESTSFSPIKIRNFSRVDRIDPTKVDLGGESNMTLFYLVFYRLLFPNSISQSQISDSKLKLH